MIEMLANGDQSFQTSDADQSDTDFGDSDSDQEESEPSADNFLIDVD